MAEKIHTLVAAGPTREKIDAVRDWGNIFTGRTGLDLALAFLDLGDVTLLTSNADHASAYDGYYGRAGMLGVEQFHSYDDLRQLLEERMTTPSPGNPVRIAALTAAISDYTPAGVYRIVSRSPAAPASGETESHHETWQVENVSAPKVKSTHGEIAVRGVMTPKLIDLFRSQWHFTGLLIKFKLEVEISEPQLLEVAGKSRLASGADLIVANTLAMARPANSQPGSAYLIDDAGAARVDRKELAGRTVEWSRKRLALKP